MCHRRGDEHVNSLEDLGELPFGQLPAPLGLHIVTGTKQPSDAEAGPRVLSEVLGSGSEVPLMEGIGLAKHNYDVGRPDIVQARYGDLLYRGTQLLKLCQPLFNDGHDFGVALVKNPDLIEKSWSW